MVAVQPFFGMLAAALFLFTKTLGQPVAELITNETLLKIALKSSSCTGARNSPDCRTAAQALPHIVNSFHKYQITHPSAQAAVISTIAYESDDFMYNKPIKPNSSSSGTRNMQKGSLNAKYAASVGVSTAGTNEEIAARLEADSDLSFGSAAWLLATQCPFTIRHQLWEGGPHGWAAYLEDCLGTEMGQDRLVYWRRPLDVIGRG